MRGIFPNVITLLEHAQVEIVISVLVSMYNMYVTIKNLNGILVVDSPFQTLAVGFSSNRLALPLHTEEMLFSLSKLNIMCTPCFFV